MGILGKMWGDGGEAQWGGVSFPCLRVVRKAFKEEVVSSGREIWVDYTVIGHVLLCSQSFNQVSW